MKHKLTRILIDGIGCAAIGVVFFLNYRYIHHKFTNNLHNKANLANYGGWFISGDALRFYLIRTTLARGCSHFFLVSSPFSDDWLVVQ
jgi:hypothetical protein